MLSQRRHRALLQSSRVVAALAELGLGAMDAELMLK
jgi:hypothetical protein